MLVFHLFYHYFLKGQNGHETAKESSHPSEPDRLGEGRGRVNPPPWRLVWRFLRFGGFEAREYRPWYTPNLKSGGSPPEKLGERPDPMIHL